MFFILNASNEYPQYMFLYRGAFNEYQQHVSTTYFYGELEKIIITKYSYLTIPLGYPMLPGITICILSIQTERPEQVHPMYSERET